MESDSSEYDKAYAPYFVVIHYMQRYLELFTENPLMQLSSISLDNGEKTEHTSTKDSISKLSEANAFFAAGNAMKTNTYSSTQRSKMPDCIYFSDAFKELLNRGGKFGIHFIISIDNPLTLTAIKNDISETICKIFVKGANSNVVTQLLGDYKASSSLNNPKVALVSIQEERSKIRVYRFDDAKDLTWYKSLCENYRKLMESRT